MLGAFTAVLFCRPPASQRHRRRSAVGSWHVFAENTRRAVRCIQQPRCHHAFQRLICGLISWAFPLCPPSSFAHELAAAAVSAAVAVTAADAVSAAVPAGKRGPPPCTISSDGSLEQAAAFNSDSQGSAQQTKPFNSESHGSVQQTTPFNSGNFCDEAPTAPCWWMPHLRLHVRPRSGGSAPARNVP